MEYKTEEGHEIVRDGEYETRSKDKATILGFAPDIKNCVIGFVVDEDGVMTQSWNKKGLLNDEVYFGYDIMRPWVEGPKKEEKIYKLSEMWRLWYWGVGPHGSCIKCDFYPELKQAKAQSTGYNAVAITRADATEFTEGEGL